MAAPIALQVMLSGPTSGQGSTFRSVVTLSCLPAITYHHGVLRVNLRFCPHPRLSVFVPILLVVLPLVLTRPLSGQDVSSRDTTSPRTESGSAYIQWTNQPTEKELPLPTGVQHLRFHSDRVDREISYCIYLPSIYQTNTSQRFPVIYNLHGNGGNEFTGLRAADLLHRQIEAGDLPPMIMVMFNGGKSTFYKNSADGKLPIESIFIEEFIPHIDQTYRTIADGKGRCIEGFSMGGRGSTRLAIKHPQMFCSLFCQAGNVPRLTQIYDKLSDPERTQAMLGSDRLNWEADDVYLNATKNKKVIKEHLRIRIACGTKDGGHLPTVRDFHQHLTELKIDHTYIELEDLAHRRTEMMDRLAPIWFDYHVESLRRSGAITSQN